MTKPKIGRHAELFQTTIADGAAVTGSFYVGDKAGGLIKFPTGVTSPATFEAQDSNGAWGAIRDASNAAVSQAFTVDEWVPLPEEILLAGGNVRATTGGNVSGDKTVEISLKG